MTGLDPNGKKSMLKLAQRMVDNFCAGVSASSVCKWGRLCAKNVSDDVRIMTRTNMEDPGEPPGILLSVSTSVWLPVSRHTLFNFLRDEQFRQKWDVLSNNDPMQLRLHIAKCQSGANCVSLLSANVSVCYLFPPFSPPHLYILVVLLCVCYFSGFQAINGNSNSMLILQETWTDASGSLIVYAPVDTPSIDVVMRGGDSTYVALLPSGFAILPGSPPGYEMVKTEGDGRADGGCFLTVGFQILGNSHPAAKIEEESIATVSTLISGTIQKIKSALQVP